MIFRTRFAGDIVAEVAVPQGQPQARRRGRVIILLDGMPAVPRKQPLMAWLAARGYWVLYPRLRGTWESGGQLLQHSPERDLSDILDELPSTLREPAFGHRFRLAPRRVFAIGASFGGAVALLSSLDARVFAVVAICPVVDWRRVHEGQPETSNPSYAAYIREAFGHGYRLSEKNWNKLQSGRFFNPVARAAEFDARKVLIFHAQDDPYIPYRQVEDFARGTGVRLRTLKTGGHLGTDRITRRYWRTIEALFTGSRQRAAQKSTTRFSAQ